MSDLKKKLGDNPKVLAGCILAIVLLIISAFYAFVLAPIENGEALSFGEFLIMYVVLCAVVGGLIFMMSS